MNSGSPWLALVALEDERLPTLLELNARLAGFFPDAPPLVEVSTSPRGVTFQQGSATVNCTLVGQPIPWERLEGPCATAWYWPEADQSMRQHKAHLLVTLLDEETDRIETAIRLTRLIATIATAVDAIGVVWGPSGQVHETSAFAGMAVQANRQDLPLHLWVDFRVTQHAEGDGFGLFTTGLEALGHSEFETPQFAGQPQDLAGAVYNVAHYVLEKGPVLKDGEAIGLPDGGQIDVRFSKSMVNSEQDVIQLQFG